MTSREITKLSKRVEMWQKRLAPLGIEHWRIDAVHITNDPPGSQGSLASVDVSDTYDSCEFWFRKDFVESATEDELDETILHEWVHVAMRDYDFAVSSAEGFFGPVQSAAMWVEWVTHEREGLVDRIARQIYAMYNES